VETITRGGRLAPYVPQSVLASLPADETAPLPRVTALRAAILISDIEGSTPLVASFTSSGPGGLDRLQLFLRQYYSALIESIELYGGVVYQFAGDSILACFERGPREADEGLAARALACAQELRSRAVGLGVLEAGDRRQHVRCKFGLALGDCHRLLLGEPLQWLHPVLVGPPITEAVGGEKIAGGGELLVSEALWRALPAREEVERREGYRVVPADHLTEGVAPPIPLTIPRATLARAARLVPPVLAHRVAAGHEDFIGDLREITALFLRFELSGGGGLPERIDELNLLYAFVQRESATYGGWLSQTDFTDKGNVLFVIFGAPNAVERRESLAARFAWMLMRERERFPFLGRLQIGLATGPAYCGNVGSMTRKGYTTIGQVANVAARLMAAVDQPGVTVDEATARQITREYALSRVEGVRLKGMGEPINAFRLHSRSSLDRLEEATSPRPHLIGRRAELGLLRDLLERAPEDGGQIALVAGEAGIGKTSLASNLLLQARAGGLQTLVGACFSFEMFTPFFPWKELIGQALGLDPLEATDRALARIRAALLEVDEAGAGWAPALAGVLGIAVEEDALTRGLDARSRHMRLFELVSRLLERRAERGPLLLLVEDVHWADRISVELLEHVAARIDSLPIVLLLTTRPGDPLQRLRELERFQLIELHQLSPIESVELVRSRLPLELPNLGLEQLILSKSQGNPFFIESIVRALTERYGQGRLGGSVAIPEDLAEITVPDSINDVVLSRIDRLEALDQALVKAASIIGRVFSLEEVTPLLPADVGERELRASLRRLAELGLIVVESSEPLVLAFQHVLIQNVAYNAQLPSSRAELHGRFARALEARATDRGVHRAGLLALHWLAANNPRSGLRYTLIAARAAREQYANRDAIHHYHRALELLTGDAPGDPAEIRGIRRELAQTLLQEGSYDEAVWMLESCLLEAGSRGEKAEVYEGLGRVYQEKGELGLAIMALETSLRLNGRRTPSSLPGLALEILLQGTLVLLGSVFGARVTRDQGRVARQLEQLATLISMIRIYYFVDAARLTWATLAALNLGRRTGSDYGLSVALTFYGTLLSAAGMLRWAPVETKRGLDLAIKAEDPVAEATAISRLGTCATFANDLDAGVDYAVDAVRRFRNVGEMWEIQTAIMLRAVTWFLKGEFDPALRSFLEMAAVARVLDARRHQAWSHGWAPMCRYLLGRSDAEAVRAELEEGLATSVLMKDQANVCTASNHLANVAVREGDAEGAARAAVAAYEAVWAYHVLVPFCQKGLIDAAEAALFALERGAVGVPRATLERVVRRCLFKARLIARLYPYLRGPRLRVLARDLRRRRGVEAAEPAFDRALAVLKASPNPWEYGVCLLDASEALPHRRGELRALAREVFELHDIQGELRRMDRD